MVQKQGWMDLPKTITQVRSHGIPNDTRIHAQATNDIPRTLIRKLRFLLQRRQIRFIPTHPRKTSAPHSKALGSSRTHLTRAIILCPLNRINIARPAFAPAPMQNVNASTAAATGKDKPKKDSWVGVAKKSMSLPIVRGTSMDTPEEMNSCAGRME